jgi:hypothetical protein
LEVAPDAWPATTNHVAGKQAAIASNAPQAIRYRRFAEAQRNAANASAHVAAINAPCQTKCSSTQPSRSISGRAKRI